MTDRKLVAAGAVVVSSILAGCHQPGPLSIVTDRPDYNDVIQDTSKQQLFMNVLRVKFNETPLFMDVSEVDAGVTLTGALMGGPGGLGAPWRAMGVASSATGTLTFTQSPTIRYSPLQGQALVAQLSTPIAVDSIVALIDSGWAIRPVLDMSTSNLVPNETPATRGKALDDIQDLHDRGLLIIAAEKWPAPGAVYAAANSFKQAPGGAGAAPPPPPSPAPAGAGAGGSPPPPSGSAPSPATPNGGNDTLVLYYTPPAGLAHVDPSWKYLNDYYGPAFQFPGCLKLPVVPTVDPRGGVPNVGTFINFTPPPLHTRSGMGVLLKFDDPALRGVAAFATKDASVAFTPAGLGVRADHFSVDLKVFKEANEHTTSGAPNPSGPRATKFSQVSGTADVLIKVMVQDFDPGAAYVKNQYQGAWYYIDRTDGISQRNFMLLAQFLTMQAGPPTLAPLTPTISVGGSGGGH